MFALDLEFDAKGRANVAALDDGAANPDVAGKACSSQRIIKCAAARIADKRMIGRAKAIFGFQLFQVGDVFEWAGAIRRSARKSPVGVRRSGRTSRKTNDSRRNVLAGKAVANEEIRGRPGLGEIGNLCDGRIGLGGMRERCGRIGSGRGNFDLGRRLDTGEFGGLIMAEPTAAEKKEYAKDEKANY